MSFEKSLLKYNFKKNMNRRSYKWVMSNCISIGPGFIAECKITMIK